MCIILLQLNNNHPAGILPMWPAAWQPAIQLIWQTSNLLLNAESGTEPPIQGVLTKDWVMLWFQWVVSWIEFCSHIRRDFTMLIIICFIACIHSFFFFIGHESGPFRIGISFRKDAKNIIPDDKKKCFRILSVSKSQTQSMCLIHLLY